MVSLCCHYVQNMVYSETSLNCHNWECQFYGGLAGLVHGLMRCALSTGILVLILENLGWISSFDRLWGGGAIPLGYIHTWDLTYLHFGYISSSTTFCSSFHWLKFAIILQYTILYN